jgi:hypothetical protein
MRSSRYGDGKSPSGFLIATYLCQSGVCTENLSSGVAVMKSAKDGV